MLQNGKKSSSRRTRHLDIRLFNIKDKLKQHNIEVRYCSKKNMIADFFTKPLQETKFRKLRRLVLGMDLLSSLDLTSSNGTKPKERVGISLGQLHSQGSAQSRERREVGLGQEQVRSFADVVIGR